MAQAAANIQVSVKRQSAKGTPASGAGASGYNVIPSQGLQLTKQPIASELVRRDGMSTRGRHGSRSSGAVYSSELSVGTFSEWIESVFRGTYVAAASVTEATAGLTSITTTTSTIVASAGSWLTAGVRRGDKVKLAGHATAANNGKWFRVVSVTASTITVAGTPLVLDAAADITFTLTIAKTVVNGTTERYNTVEEYEQDDDQSVSGTDMKIAKMEFSALPNKHINVTFTFMGLNATINDTGAAPVLTSPTYATTLPLVMVDGTIRIGGVDYDVLTGFTFVLDLGGVVPPTLSTTSPDVYLGNAKISGSFTALKSNLVFLQAFDAETQVDFFFDCEENEADPTDFASFYIGNATFSGYSSAIASDGPRTLTIPWTSGIDEGGSDRVATMVKHSTSV